MVIEQNTPYGGISIAPAAIANVAADAVLASYGVVGLSAAGSKEMLDKEQYTKAVTAKKAKNGFVIEIFVILAYGVKITEIVAEIQKQVKFVLEKTFGIRFTAINVYVQGIALV